MDNILVCEQNIAITEMRTFSSSQISCHMSYHHSHIHTFRPLTAGWMKVWYGTVPYILQVDRFPLIPRHRQSPSTRFVQLIKSFLQIFLLSPAHLREKRAIRISTLYRNNLPAQGGQPCQMIVNSSRVITTHSSLHIPSQHLYTLTSCVFSFACLFFLSYRKRSRNVQSTVSQTLAWNKCLHSLLSNKVANGASSIMRTHHCLADSVQYQMRIDLEGEGGEACLGST